MSIKDCKKIIVVGNAGSGKTVFSLRLAQILSLPLIHLDREYWQSAWVETPRELWFEKHRKLLKGSEWIIDGNYGSTLKERFHAADAVVFLDVGTPLCVLNLIKRRMKYSKTDRPDLPEDCPEFLRPDELRKTLTYARTERNRVLSYMTRFPRDEMVTLYSIREANKFLDELEKRNEGPTD